MRSSAPGATSVAAAALALALAGCGAAALRPFPDRPIVWRDDDLRPWGPAPQPEVSHAVWDAADGLFFREPLRALDAEPARRSVDVNALDEVPDSSFFENRIGRDPRSPEEVARGACGEGDPGPEAARPWRVLRAKTDGMQPGLFVEDAAGVRYLLKTDGVLQPERATAADAVVAALLHAAGYHVPCNRVVLFDARDVVPGGDVDRADVERVLAAATRRRDGRLRASLSRLLEGEPLGPWSQVGRWERDARDRVPHELRREVRALAVFAAWVDHVDARAHNSLALWIDAGGGRGHVRHALVDFGDSLGATSEDARRAARYGHTHWLSLGTSLEDVVTLGLLPRPWYREPASRDERIGDFGTEPFDPDAWRPNYPPGAFERADESDRAWAARIVARFTPAHLRALARLARFERRETEDALAAALASRRRAILERHLAARSPLSWPTIDGGALCLEDLAVSGGVRDPSERRDDAATVSARVERGQRLAVRREGARVCVELPRRPPRHLVVDVVAETPALDRPGPARVHLRTDGRVRVVGLERPRERSAPP